LTADRQLLNIFVLDPGIHKLFSRFHKFSQTVARYYVNYNGTQYSAYLRQGLVCCKIVTVKKTPGSLRPNPNEK